MSEPQAFFDTSSIVPMCFEEAASSAALMLQKQFVMAVWWETIVECESAFSRLVRMGQLEGTNLTATRRRLRSLSANWTEIFPIQKIRSDAIELLHRHPLRAADAVQLAAAFEWRKSVTGNVFVSGDERLLNAAMAEGFEVRQT